MTTTFLKLNSFRHDMMRFIDFLRSYLGPLTEVQMLKSYADESWTITVWPEPIGWKPPSKAYAGLHSWSVVVTEHELKSDPFPQIVIIGKMMDHLFPSVDPEPPELTCKWCHGEGERFGQECEECYGTGVQQRFVPDWLWD